MNILCFSIQLAINTINILPNLTIQKNDKNIFKESHISRSDKWFHF